MLQSVNKTRKFISALVLSISALALTGQPLMAQPFAEEKQEVAVPAKVNINEADAATIAEVLQGVGASRAKAIVEYREKNGPFSSVEELGEVKGIGDSTLNLNKERIALE
jgi:competence protein ComEA